MVQYVEREKVKNLPRSVDEFTLWRWGNPPLNQILE